MPVSTDTPTGWMPGVHRTSIPASNYSVLSTTRKAVVLHIIEGSAGSALSVFKQANSQKSSHFIVSKAGIIWQCVSIDDSAYANGLSWSESEHCWVDPQSHLLKAPLPTPAWTGLTPPVNPNLTTISIEREGYYQDIPTAAQNEAVVTIMRWCAEQYPMLAPYSFMHSLIGHCHISPVSKANCPGPHVQYAALAAAANGAVAPPLVITRDYTVKHRYVTQRMEDNGPPYVRELVSGEPLVVDKWYTNGRAHLASGEGFVDLVDLEPV